MHEKRDTKTELEVEKAREMGTVPIIQTSFLCFGGWEGKGETFLGSNWLGLAWTHRWPGVQRQRSA